mmetsp:Transcript_14580/g.41662  ORF Transcript_14580/g.41662 Transcript_14580/m.41662 type:complete len:218 (-) Transcript_14580:122-775(-)
MVGNSLRIAADRHSTSPGSSRASVAIDHANDSAFSCVLGSSAGSRQLTTRPTPPSSLRSSSSKASTWRTRATRALKAFARSSEPSSDSLAMLRNLPKQPRLKPTSWIFGLFCSSSEKMSSVRARNCGWLPSRSSSGCTPSSFSMFRAQSRSSQHLSITSRAVAMPSFVRSCALICWMASAITWFGSSSLPKASSMAFSRNSRSSSDNCLKLLGAVPS